MNQISMFAKHAIIILSVYSCSCGPVAPSVSKVGIGSNVGADSSTPFTSSTVQLESESSQSINFQVTAETRFFAESLDDDQISNDSSIDAFTEELSRLRTSEQTNTSTRILEVGEETIESIRTGTNQVTLESHFPITSDQGRARITVLIELSRAAFDFTQTIARPLRAQVAIQSVSHRGRASLNYQRTTITIQDTTNSAVGRRMISGIKRMAIFVR